MSDSAGFQRLHPASLLFLIGRALGQFLVPALVVLVLGRGERSEVWIALFAIPATAFALVRYFTYRYRLSSDELVIREGVVRRNERHVPYERIQNIDTTRSLLHRVLGVADVSIQTASGAAAEAVMRVLSLTAVEAMRRRVFTHPTTEGDPEAAVDDDAVADESHHVLAAVGTADLVRYGIISNRGLVALAAVLGLVWQADVDPTPWITRHVPGMSGVELPRLVLTAALLVVAGLIALRLLSIAWSVVTFYGFTLSREQDELVARYGLLTEHAVTIPGHRIQLVTAEENLLHRAFGRISLRARTAGSGSDEQHHRRHDWLVPVLPRRQLEPLLAAVHGDLVATDLDWQPLPRRAVWRPVKRWLLVTTLLWLPLIVIDVRLAAGLPVVAAVIALVAAQGVRHTAWATTPDAIWLRRGWLGRSTRVVRHATIQTVARTESPFDRRAGMAAVEVDTANSGLAGAAIRIPYLEGETAGILADRLATAAAVTAFRW